MNKTEAKKRVTEIWANCPILGTASLDRLLSIIDQIEPEHSHEMTNAKGERLVHAHDKTPATQPHPLAELKAYCEKNYAYSSLMFTHDRLLLKALAGMMREGNKRYMECHRPNVTAVEEAVDVIEEACK